MNVELFESIGEEIYSLVKALFPICRSLTGDGVRRTLAMIQEKIPGMKIYEVPTGTVCYDWVIPKEWNVRDAYIIDPEGNKIVDFKENNLHLVGYSIPVDSLFTLEELQEHLHSLPDQPEAIPYITSYYKAYWGFCLSHHQRQTLKKGNYRVKIDTELKNGSLSYGELIIPGQSSQEIFLSSYICHPSMANNELSGPCLLTYLARWIASLSERRYTYRIIFIPETIGSIMYISKHLDELKENVKAGFIVTCIGDERSYSYLPSRAGDTLSDKAALHALSHIDPNFKRYSYLNRGAMRGSIAVQVLIYRWPPSCAQNMGPIRNTTPLLTTCS